VNHTTSHQGQGDIDINIANARSLLVQTSRLSPTISLCLPSLPPPPSVDTGLTSASSGWNITVPSRMRPATIASSNPRRIARMGMPSSSGYCRKLMIVPAFEGDSAGLKKRDEKTCGLW
jgi:hypothetical protein